MASAQAGARPFKYDYIDPPPAMAAAEAPSVGPPTVATDVSCLRAVVEDGVNGMVVPPFFSPALRSGFGGLLRQYEAPWKRYADAGPITVTRRLGWDQMAATTSAAYDAALESASPRLPVEPLRPGAVRALLPTSLERPTRIAVIDTRATGGLPTDF